MSYAMWLFVAAIVFVIFFAIRFVVASIWKNEQTAQEKYANFFTSAGGLCAGIGMLTGIVNFSLTIIIMGYVYGAAIFGIGFLVEFAFQAIEARKKRIEGIRIQHMLETQKQEKEEHERERRAVEEKEAIERSEQLEAEKKKLRIKRDEEAGTQALLGHMAVIVGAVRALTPGGEHAVLLNTIDGEVKSIARNDKITEAMVKGAEVQEEISLVLARLGELGIADKILDSRITRTFRLEGRRASSRKTREKKH